MFKKNDVIVCRVDRDARSLTQGNEYLVTKDEEPGIFPTRPYVTVETQFGEVTYHASRFESKQNTE